MMQPSLTLLALTLREATDYLGSVRTLKSMPTRLRDGFFDMTLAVINCFPEAAEEFDDLMDNYIDFDFDFLADAQRLIHPLVDQVTYPLHTEHEIMLEDTPLVMTLDPASAMGLLKKCLGHDEHLDYEPDATRCSL